LLDSHRLWENLWVDARVITENKNETPTEYEQLWFRPEKVRWISAQKGRAPILMFVNSTTGNELIQLPNGERLATGENAALPSRLQDLINPTSFAMRGGNFEPVRLEISAERETLVVEWSVDGKTIEDRFWIDIVTGVILHWQHLKQESPNTNGQIIPSEIVLSSIRYPVQIPESVAWTNNLDLVQFEPGPAPQDFSAAASPLQSFVTMNGDPGSGIENFAYDLYAESYYLGTIFTGAVSGGWCARSPIGERLAWNFTDGILPGTLRWVNLFDLYTVHQPIPLDILGGGLFSAPAFAPGNLRLAFSACLAEGCGVYILHLETGALLKTKTQGLSSL
jgi:hypothetical protein